MQEKLLLDRRVQRTRRLLQDALFHLIIAHAYETITIQDITEEANLGRTTFYLHYRDKDHLLREGISALLHSMQLVIEADGKDHSFSDLCSRIFHHVEREQQLYRALLKETGSANNFGIALRTYFAELCQRFLPGESPQPNCPAFANSEMFAAHASGSLMGLISWWLEHDTMPDAEQMGIFYYQLMSNANRLPLEVVQTVDS